MIWRIRRGRSARNGSSFGGRTSSLIVFRGHPKLHSREGQRRTPPGDPIDTLTLRTKEPTIRVRFEMVKCLGPGPALCFAVLEHCLRRFYTPGIRAEDPLKKASREREFPTREKVAELLGVGRDQVSRYLRVLTSNHLIPPARNARPTGREAAAMKNSNVVLIRAGQDADADGMEKVRQVLLFKVLRAWCRRTDRTATLEIEDFCWMLDRLPGTKLPKADPIQWLKMQVATMPGR